MMGEGRRRTNRKVMGGKEGKNQEESNGGGEGTNQ